MLFSSMFKHTHMEYTRGEYDIPAEEDIRKDVSIMCNLSQGIEDKGIAIGPHHVLEVPWTIQS